MEFRPIHQIPTPEQVPITVELAGIASRVFAFLIDFILMGVIMGTTFIAGMMLAIVNPELSRSLLPVAMFLIFFGFFMIQEWLLNGRTLGKYLFNIRVVRNDGQPIGFWEAFGRNLFRVVDVYLSGIGLLAMLVSAQEKRFGDYVSGTIVVSENAWLKSAAPGQLQPGGNGDDWISGLQPHEYELINRFLQRRSQLASAAVDQLEKALAGYLRERMAPLPPELAEQSDAIFLTRLQTRYREQASSGQ